MWRLTLTKPDMGQRMPVQVHFLFKYSPYHKRWQVKTKCCGLYITTANRELRICFLFFYYSSWDFSMNAQTVPACTVLNLSCCVVIESAVLYRCFFNRLSA